jgi:hypothetical protein
MICFYPDLGGGGGAKLGGSLQLDMTYETIPIFGGQTRRLYREEKIAYTISDSTNPKMFPIYVENDDLEIFFLSVNTDEYSSVVQEPLLKNIETKNHENKVGRCSLMEHHLKMVQEPTLFFFTH